MLGDDLREARLERGLSQTALADELGLSSRSITLWETGGGSPGPESLQKLESFFDTRFSVVAPDDFDAAVADTPPPAKDKAPTPKKRPAPKKAGMPSLAVQLEMPYHLLATASRTRLPYTSAVLDQQAGPCAAAWDQFLNRYPKLREKIEQGAVAADIVNLVYAHLPIVTVAREEIAAQQAQANFMASQSDANAA